MALQGEEWSAEAPSAAQRWVLDRRALRQVARMQTPRPTGLSAADFQLRERTVEIGDAPCETGGDRGGVGAPGTGAGAAGAWRRLRRGCGALWPAFLGGGSEYASEEERLYRPTLNIVTKALLRTVVVLMLAWQLALTLFMAIDGDYDLGMFTFWNYTMTTVLVAFLAASLFYERILLTFTLLFFFPVVFGDNAIVRFGIVVIVGRNAAVFLGDGSQSVSTRYVGDFVVHSLPLGMLLVVLLAGLLLYMRRAVGYERGLFRTPLRWWLYCAYWILAPLVPLAIYTACFDIAKVYPTGIATGLLWLAMIGVDVVWMGFFLLIFVAVAKFSVQFTVFYADRHRTAVAAAAAAAAQTGGAKGGPAVAAAPV